ncbi:MAG TPA: hypothetical protein VJT71_13430 [Pyrinomonadaceae bacterium]|nr:hypothetical protein [Pyrinomonadaceae bacterium]
MTTSQNSDLKPTDEVIRGFLLGCLNAADQEEFEGQLISDERLHERVRHAEFQLADEFAGEQIGRIDRHRFLKNFLVTTERKRIVAASEALRQSLSLAIDARAIPPASWRHLFDFRKSAWRYAFGALVLLFLIGSFWLVTKERKIITYVIPKRIFRRPAATVTPQETHHPPNTAPPEHRESAASPPGHEALVSPGDSAQKPVVVLSLTAGGDVSQASSMSLPAADVVRFQLAFEGDRLRPLRIELNNLEGQSVFFAEAPAIEKNYGRIDFDVPANRFKSGSYQIRVSEADNAEQEVARYYFRVP